MVEGAIAGPYRAPLTRGPGAFCWPAAWSWAAVAVVGVGTEGENGVLYVLTDAGLADAGTNTPSRMRTTAGAKPLIPCHALILLKPPQQWRHDLESGMAAATFRWLPIGHPSGQPLPPSPSPGRPRPMASRAGTNSAETRDLVNEHVCHFDSLPRPLTPARARRRGAGRERNPGSQGVHLHHGSPMVQDRGIRVASRLRLTRPSGRTRGRGSLRAAHGAPARGLRHPGRPCRRAGPVHSQRPLFARPLDPPDSTKSRLDRCV